MPQGQDGRYVTLSSVVQTTTPQPFNKFRGHASACPIAREETFRGHNHNHMPAIACALALAWRDIVVLFCLYFGFIIAGTQLEVPIVRLVEQAICNRYFSSRPSGPGHIDEADRKIHEVQDVLTDIIGWKMAFNGLPGKGSALTETGARALTCCYSPLGLITPYLTVR